MLRGILQLHLGSAGERTQKGFFFKLWGVRENTLSKCRVDKTIKQFQVAQDCNVEDRV